MIAVVGSPILVPGEPDSLAGLAVAIARAAARAGARVELVGKVGDDRSGDEAVLRLDRAGVRHAALLRDPRIATPALRGGQGERRPVERPVLEPADLELALRYLPDVRVIVVAEPLGSEAIRIVGEAAGFHEAELVVVVPAGGSAPGGLERATVLEAPLDPEEGSFAQLVARYAVALDAGRPATEAFVALTGAAERIVPADPPSNSGAR